jgi:hypothetical protein
MNTMKDGCRDGIRTFKNSLRKKGKSHVIQVVAGFLLNCLLVLRSDALDWPTLNFPLVTTNLSFPLGITHAGDGSGRLFIVEESGTIRIVQNGVALNTPLLDISDRVWFGGAGSEDGLLGLAFPPNYQQKGYFYVNYIRKPDGATIVSRFFLTDDANLASAKSEQILLTLPQPYANHNGGQLAFGPDGYLYIALGDGGEGGDPDNRAQDPGQLYGKILRIDVEGSPTNSYRIPVDNPFVDDPDYLPEIWALGLRNPWRFSFDKLTGDIYIADVGEEDQEEIDFQPAASAGGENYGWRIMQGDQFFNIPSGFNMSETNNLTLPVMEYSHDVGHCVIGGYVGRDASAPRMVGTYLYADYVDGQIWGLRKDGASWRSAQLADTTYSISSFGQDEAGRIYFVDYKAGSLYSVIDEMLLIKGISMGAGGSVTLKWDALANRTYQAQFSSDLSSWSDLGSAVSGTGGELSVTDANAIGASARRFYRLSTVSP